MAASCSMFFSKGDNCLVSCSSTIITKDPWVFRHFGESYKWLLYGDDDTFFFLDAAMQVLQHLDPEMPYFLTGEALLIACHPAHDPFPTWQYIHVLL